jgi:hypothetical protein
MLSVATLIKLPFPASPPSGPTRHRIGVRVYGERRYSLISSSKPCESHTPEHPVQLPVGALPLSFPTVSVVPTVNYYDVLSLARLQVLNALPPRHSRLRARSYFVLTRVRLPHYCLVSVATLYSASVTAQPVTRASSLSTPLQSSEVLPRNHSYSSRFISSSPETSPVL